LRRAIGGTGLMIDANHGYDRIDAARLADRVEELDIGWFEEPVAPEDVDGYRWLKGETSIPLAGGECAFTRFDFQKLMDAEALDIVQPDTCAAGGLSECLKIAALVSARGLRYHPHVWGTGIAVAAALQLIAVLPPAARGFAANEPLLEFDRTPHPFRDAILERPFTLAGGRVAVPDGPGLGIEVDRDALARFRIEP
jgi:D-galactarolactone cycloisomerase